MVASQTEWRYLRIFPGAVEFLHWEPVGDDNILELIIKPGNPFTSVSNYPDGSLHTGDIFLRHPTDPDMYYCLGRIDDTIVMLNGEKANPLPLELEVNLHPYVKDLVCVGTQQATLGLFVVPSEKASMDGKSKEEIVDAIWGNVEIGNKNMPHYARIAKDSILVLDHGLEYEKTLKGTVKRAQFIRQFADMIKEFYRKLEGAGWDGEKKQMNEEEMKELVRTTINEVMGLEKEKLKDDADFFTFGMDSSMAIQARRYLAQKIDTKCTKLNANFVFEHPTVDALAEFLTGLQSGMDQAKKSAEAEIMATLKVYDGFSAASRDSPPPPPPSRAQGGEHIVRSS